MKTLTMIKKSVILMTKVICITHCKECPYYTSIFTYNMENFKKEIHGFCKKECKQVEIKLPRLIEAVDFYNFYRSSLV